MGNPRKPRSRLKGPILYDQLAPWWPLCSSPEEYREEAGIYYRALAQHARRPLRSVLELGSGGGNNASHLKHYFQMTLVDLSPGMLRVSRKLNPDCKHARGDMRSIRLHREFDAVFIHDAIDYMLTSRDLLSALETAYVHCRPGGIALFVPDWTRERFRPSTSYGGRDSGDRGMRYLEWTIDPNPNDNQYSLYMSYLVRTGARIRPAGLDEHKCGLFSEGDWIRLLRHAGFKPRKLPYDHSSWERHAHVMFLGLKPD